MEDGFVIGEAQMSMFMWGDLHRIGECITPGSTDSGINAIAERYEIRIIDICHIGGGHYITHVYANVIFATKSVWRPILLPWKLLTMDQLIKDWEALQVLCKRFWDSERETGQVITTLILKKLEYC